MFIRLLLIGYFTILGAIIFAQDTTAYLIQAKVSADTGLPTVDVAHLRLDFRFAGYGIYQVNDYPLLKHIPLETGEYISFENISNAVFESKKVHWKAFVEPVERIEFENIDSLGFRHWQSIEIYARIKDWKGDTIKARIQRPEESNVFLTGRTKRGDYILKLNTPGYQRIKVDFAPHVTMQCPKEMTHTFPNSSFQYCPYCGIALKRISTNTSIKDSLPAESEPNSIK